MVKKIHTRIKRMHYLSTHLRHHTFFHKGTTKVGAKTFKTQESADAWAKVHGLGPEDYHLKSVKRNKRFQIVKMKGVNENGTN
ncbi:MAG: hypothetical protein ABH879_01770 [archaeon]